MEFNFPNPPETQQNQSSETEQVQIWIGMDEDTRTERRAIEGLKHSDVLYPLSDLSSLPSLGSRLNGDCHHSRLLFASPFEKDDFTFSLDNCSFNECHNERCRHVDIRRVQHAVHQRAMGFRRIKNRRRGVPTEIFCDPQVQKKINDNDCNDDDSYGFGFEEEREKDVFQSECNNSYKDRECFGTVSGLLKGEAHSSSDDATIDLRSENIDRSARVSKVNDGNVNVNVGVTISKQETKTCDSIIDLCGKMGSSAGNNEESELASELERDSTSTGKNNNVNVAHKTSPIIQLSSDSEDSDSDEVILVESPPPPPPPIARTKIRNRTKRRRNKNTSMDASRSYKKARPRSRRRVPSNTAAMDSHDVIVLD